MNKIVIASLLTLSCSLSQASDYSPAAGLSASQIYSEACASCHGDAGAGKFGVLLKLAGTELSSDQITHKIKTGGTLMPSYPNIKPEQLLQLTKYIKTLPAD